MSQKDLFAFAFMNLKRAKLRNTLTMLGVAIGTAALVSMLSYGTGLQKTFTDEFSDLELFNTVRIASTKSDLSNLLSFSKKTVKNRNKPESDNEVVLTKEVLTQVEKLATEISPSTMVYPEIVFPCKIFIDSMQTAVMTEALPASIRNTPGYNQIRYGKFFESDSSNEVVVSEILLNRMGIEYPESVIGKPLKLVTITLDPAKIAAYAAVPLGMNGNLPVAEKEYTFIIGGVLDKNIQKLSSGLRLILPMQSAQKLQRLNFLSTIDLLRKTQQKDGYQAIIIRTQNQADAEKAKVATEKIGLNPTSFTEQFNEFKRLFVIFDMALGVVGTIALIVATLGITNTMIMSIMERYREIGIMKAVGASDGDVRKIILVESAVIGLVGGIGGVVLGRLATSGINQLANIYVVKQTGAELTFFYFPVWLVGSAILFSIAVSIIAGFYPANRAAKVQPVEALRHQA
jgi:putative ABC transport system permease protein